MFGWERRAAANGARRLAARGNTSRFLGQGLEAYSYLLSGAIWIVAGGAVGILVFFPTLILQSGMTVVSGVELFVVYALLVIGVLRLWQSKRSRLSPS
jgi:hypothetical protein